MERAGRMPIGSRPARRLDPKKKTICCSSKACLLLETLQVSDPCFVLAVAEVVASAGRILDAPESADRGDSGAPVGSSVRAAD
jgi:hypothetical protein